MLAYCGRRAEAQGEDPKLAGRLLGWDLATGEALGPIDVLRRTARAVTAVDARRVLLDGRLIDLRNGLVVARYDFTTALADSPDARPWGFGLDDAMRGPAAFRGIWASQLRPAELPGFDTGPSDLNEAFTSATPLALQIDLGSEERSRTLGREELAVLQRRGQAIGPGGWLLKASHKVVDSDQSFLDGTRFPGLEVNWELVAPDGTVAWKFPQLFDCQEALKKYESGSKVVGKGRFVVAQRGGVSQEEIVQVSYDFGGGKPRTVLTDDMLESAQHGTVAVPVVGRFQGTYQPLPAEAKALFP
jgi:hypothetical protein